MSFFDDDIGFDDDAPDDGGASGGNLGDPIVYEVDTPGGSTQTLITERERDHYQDLAKGYLTHNKFQNTSDLSDLDRLLAMETLIWRWQQWISSEKDYWGGTPDMLEIRRNIKEWSGETRLLKKQMGLDKATREKERGAGSIADHWENLKVRAKEFGIKRNEMAVLSITLLKHIEGLVTLHDNCTPDEREEMDVEPKDILDWIRKHAIPQLQAVDEALRAEQRYWIREL